ncbi:PhoH family protein [Selenomonadales bacterium OttesenSCG-928-I06]|nr:PhoH family protein [Selenomonadales bacterium OttesenSCG-928-I06]
MEKRIAFNDTQETVAVLGKNDEHIPIFREEFAVNIIPRGNELILEGQSEAEIENVYVLILELMYLYREGNQVTGHDVRYAIKMIKTGKQESLHQMFADTILVTVRGRQIKPKTIKQKFYLDAIRKNYVTFGIGPAGTGKTYLAVAMAVFALKNKLVEKIVLTRPAVEAGEKLGFLPGDLQEKVDPYLRPLYDALSEMLGSDVMHKFMAKNIIEIAPLAYMRGRTLDDSFIILDEAQNTTIEQMKMFLTRMGFNSKMVITGDVTQTDLPHDRKSGLKHAYSILENITGIKTVFFDETDVVRHEIVSKIIKAYEMFENK